jgi:WD40 repeat protein
LGRFPEATGGVVDLAVSPDGQLVCIAAMDGRLTLWRPGTGEIRRSGAYRFRNEPGETSIQSVVFSPNGGCVAWTGSDRIIRVWDVNKFCEIRRFDGHEGAVSQVIFSKNSDLIASASDDGTILIWQIVHSP